MEILILMGCMWLAGYAVGLVAAHLGFPRITGYLIAGIFMNPSLIPFINKGTVDQLGFIMPVVLGFISYMIGGALRLETLRKLGKVILSITIFQGLTPFFLTLILIAGIGPFVLSLPGGAKDWIPMALILSAISASSAPAAIVAILHECRAKGPVSTTALAVLALTDGFTVLAFAISMGVGRVLLQGGWAAGAGDMLLVPLVHIFGSLAVGLTFGYLLWKALEKVRGSLWILLASLAGILIMTVLTETYNLSPFLANMAAGFIVVNGSNREGMITVLERIEDPLFALFFVLNGMYIDLTAVGEAGTILILIMVGRKIGKYAGARIGAVIIGAPKSLQKFPGFLLLPKAGLTLGLAFIARQAFPSFGDLMFNALLASTVVNMLVTPPLAKYALIKAGEAGNRESPD